MASQSKTLTLGSSASSLDIFLEAANTPTNASFVGYQLFDAASNPAFSGIALNPSVGTYTASGTIPSTAQTTSLPVSLGDWQIKWDIISTAGSFLSVTEDFCVQDINIKIGFVDDTDNRNPIFDAIRLDIGDPDGVIFDDGYLNRIVVKSVRRLNQRLGLSVTSRPKGIPGNFGGQRLKVAPITFNSDNGTVTPNNDELIDLIILQSELIILVSEVSNLKRAGAQLGTGPFANLAAAANAGGVTVVNADGVRVSTSSSQVTSKADLHKFDVQMKTKELDDAVKAFLNRMTGNFGKLIY
jgi:hypothetical protein